MDVPRIVGVCILFAALSLQAGVVREAKDKVQSVEEEAQYRNLTVFG